MPSASRAFTSALCASSVRTHRSAPLSRLQSAGPRAGGRMDGANEPRTRTTSHKDHKERKSFFVTFEIFVVHDSSWLQFDSPGAHRQIGRVPGRTCRRRSASGSRSGSVPARSGGRLPFTPPAVHRRRYAAAETRVPVAVAHPAAINEQRAIEDRPVAIGKAAQTLQEFRQQARVISVRPSRAPRFARACSRDARWCGAARSRRSADRCAG